MFGCVTATVTITNTNLLGKITVNVHLLLCRFDIRLTLGMLNLLNLVDH